MRVIDSHTEGQPTRLVLDQGPDLGSGSLAEQADRLFRDHADFCRGVLCEPRGHEAMVGALLLPPNAPGCAAGVIYFNPAGPLGMCGHATIGTAVSLAHCGRLSPGVHRFDTPVGPVEVSLETNNRVSVENVEAFRHRADVVVEVPGWGPVRGDVAWGGNWFFLTKECQIPLVSEQIAPLTRFSTALKEALEQAGITGEGGALIDHIELTGPSPSAHADGRNFVLCPGGAYDRSPCGTGSSAKLACLAANGLLAPGERWVQESIIGSTYTLSYRPGPAGGVVTTITGSAFVTAESILHFEPSDPYRTGIILEERH